MVIRRNDRCLYRGAKNVPTAMHTEFLASLLVLRVVSNEGGHAISDISKDFRVNSADYKAVLKRVVKTCIESVNNGRLYTY